MSAAHRRQPPLPFSASSSNDNLIQAKDAATMLSISLQHFYRLVREGKIPPVRIGKRGKRYDRAVLAAFKRRGGTEED